DRRSRAARSHGTQRTYARGVEVHLAARRGADGRGVSMLDQITPVILTRDEAANIERTLGRLAWANDVVVVDSFSTDTTLEIARSFPNVRVFQRELDSLAGQSNYGIQQVRTPWILLMDADYFLPDGFVEELRALAPPPSVRAYRGSFTYAVHGRPLRASLYPPRIV